MYISMLLEKETNNNEARCVGRHGLRKGYIQRSVRKAEKESATGGGCGIATGITGKEVKEKGWRGRKGENEAMQRWTRYSEIAGKAAEGFAWCRTHSTV